MHTRGTILLQTPTHRRGGFALLMSMLLITLLLAVTAELVSVTSVEAISSARRNRTCAHELAVDSALLVLAEQLSAENTQGSPLIRQLDQAGVACMSFPIGPVAVRCTLRDDAAKLSPLPFQRPDQQQKLTRKLTTLAGRRALPPVKVALKPVVRDSSSPAGPVYHWYDQVLSDVQPGAVFRWNEGADIKGQMPVWSDVLTFWGDGRIDLRRVDADVLEATLEDIRPGLGRLMLAARPADRSLSFLQSALARVHAEIRQQVAARVTYNTRRYAIRMDTAVDADLRRWYVVATIAGGELSVLHRSQVTW